MIRTKHASVGDLQPGRYVIVVKPVVVAESSSRVRAGATAYPGTSRLVANVRAGKATRLTVLYSAVVNPGVQPLPKSILRVMGDTSNPTAVVLLGRIRPPTVGYQLFGPEHVHGVIVSSGRYVNDLAGFVLPNSVD